jgi:hypothetical protein
MPQGVEHRDSVKGRLGKARGGREMFGSRPNLRNIIDLTQIAPSPVNRSPILVRNGVLLFPLLSGA